MASVPTAETTSLFDNCEAPAERACALTRGASDPGHRTQILPLTSTEDADCDATQVSPLSITDDADEDATRTTLLVDENEDENDPRLTIAPHSRWETLRVYVRRFRILRLMEMLRAHARSLDVRARTRRQSGASGVFAQVVLVDNANAEAMKLLMRGMPRPATFGFPETDGTLMSNFKAFVRNFHPLFSACCAHPIHPFTRFERKFVYACSAIFSLLVNQYMYTHFAAWHGHGGYEACGVVELSGSCAKFMFSFKWLVAKWTLVIVYAVVIRQLVIRPQETARVLELRDAMYGDDDGARRDAARESRRYLARKRDRQRWLVFLTVAHAGLLVMFAIIANGLDRASNAEIVEAMALQEALAVVHWFARFAPLFFFFFPAHRYQWYHRVPENDALRRAWGCGARGEVAGYTDTLRHRLGEHCVTPVMSGCHFDTVDETLDNALQSYDAGVEAV